MFQLMELKPEKKAGRALQPIGSWMGLPWLVMVALLTSVGMQLVLSLGLGVAIFQVSRLF
jgi:hypothetical protein